MTVSLSSVANHQVEHTALFRIPELKVTTDINPFENFDPIYDISLLNSIDTFLSGLKDQILDKVPKNVSEVGIYYNVLEDLPNCQTCNSTEGHKNISIKVLSETFGIVI